MPIAMFAILPARRGRKGNRMIASFGKLLARLQLPINRFTYPKGLTALCRETAEKIRSAMT